MKKNLQQKKKIQNNKKGFTLIEVLAIVVIISIVGGIASRSIINIINSSKEEEVALSEENIKKAANTYAQENTDVVWSVDTNTNNKISCVSIAELINQGYYDEKITSKNYNEFIIIRKDINNETIINEEFDKNGTTCNAAFQFVEKPTCADLTYNTKKQTLINLNDENNQNKYIIEDNSTNIGQDAGTYTVKVKPDSEKLYIWKNGRNNETEVTCTIKPVKTYIVLDPEVQGDLEDEVDYNFYATPKVKLDTTGLTEAEITTANNLFKEQSGKITATSSNKEYVTTSVDPNTTNFETALKINLKAITARKTTTKVKVTFTPNNSNFEPSSNTFQLAKKGITEYAITLNANGGKFNDNSETTEIKVLKNGEYGESLDINLPTKNGYTFAGWYTAASGGTKVTASSKITENKNHTLYAHYTAIESTVTLIGNKFSTYNQTTNGVTINYDASTSYLTLNGTQTASIKLLLSQNETFTSGDKYNITLTYISGNYTATNSHRFVTEPKKSGGTALTTRNNLDLAFPTSGTTSGTLTISSTAASEGTTLYNWIWVNSSGAITYNNYKVKVTVTKVVTKTVKYNSTYGSLTTPVRYGYAHTAWYDAETSGNAVTSSSTVTKTTNHNLYATSTPIIYTIAYNCNDGTGTTASSTHTFNVAKTLTSNNCSRTGYTYEGWATSSSGSKVYSDKQSVTNLSSTNKATVTLYAKWTAQTYTISYDANGGTGAPSEQSKTHGISATLSSTTPTHSTSGSIFNGWNDKQDGSGTSYNAGGTYSTNKSVTLYAQWKQVYYQISSPSTYTTTINDAISKANSGSTITLLASLTDNTSATFGKSLTFNMSDSTLTRTTTITVSNGATLTVTGGTGKITNSTTNTFTVNGKLNFQSGIIDNTKSITANSAIDDKGTFLTETVANYIKEVATIYTSGTGIADISGGTIYGNINFIHNSTGTATISGGSLKGGYYSVSNTNTGKISITGGTIYGDNGLTIQNYVKGTIDIDKAYIDNGSSYSIYNRSGTINISNINISPYAIPVRNDNGTINISSSTISATSSSAVYNAGTGTIIIEKSKITGKTDGSSVIVNGGNTHAIMKIYSSTIEVQNNANTYAISNKGGDLRLYNGCVVTSSHTEAAAIANTGTYKKSGSNYWGRVYVENGLITGGKYGIYSNSGNNSVHVGYQEHTLVNTVTAIEKAKGTNAPLVSGEEYGVYMYTGSAILDNGIIRGKKYAAEPTPTTQRNETVKKYSNGSVYKYRYRLE